MQSENGLEHKIGLILSNDLQLFSKDEIFQFIDEIKTSLQSHPKEAQIEHIQITFDILLTEFQIVLIQCLDADSDFWLLLKQVSKEFYIDLAAKCILKYKHQIDKWSYAADLSQNILAILPIFKQEINEKIKNEKPQYSKFEKSYFEISDKHVAYFHNINGILKRNDNLNQQDKKHVYSIFKHLQGLQTQAANFDQFEQNKVQLQQECMQKLVEDINLLISALEYGDLSEVVQEVMQQLSNNNQNQQKNQENQFIQQKQMEIEPQNFPNAANNQQSILRIPEPPQNQNQQFFQIPQQKQNIYEIQQKQQEQQNQQFQQKLQKQHQQQFQQKQQIEPKQDHESHQENLVQKRTFFFKNEQLFQPENDMVEFKNYYLETDKKTQQKQFPQEYLDRLFTCILAMLNHKGGRLFIGIKEANDSYIVQGNTMSMKDIDQIRLQIQNHVLYNRKIHPWFENHLMNICFLPVYLNKQREFTGAYIIKVIIKQGDPKDLYCDKEFKCYLRRDGQNEQLQVEHFKKELIRRSKIQIDEEVYRKHNATLDDPNPEIPQTRSKQITINDNQQNRQQKNTIIIQNNLLILEKVSSNTFRATLANENLLIQLNQHLHQQKNDFQILMQVKQSGNTSLDIILQDQTNQRNLVMMCQNFYENYQNMLRNNQF